MKLEDIKVIKDSMENCCKLTVPSKVDVEIGDNWGNAKWTIIKQIYLNKVYFLLN